MLSDDIRIRESKLEDTDYFYKCKLTNEVGGFFSIENNQSYDTVIRMIPLFVPSYIMMKIYNIF
jgi:hypothetical protein